MTKGSKDAGSRSSVRGIWVGAGVLGIAALTGVYWYIGRDNVLSEKPERKASSESIPSRTSNVNLRLAIPHSVIQAAADKHLPASFSKSGTGDDACKSVLGVRLCAGTKYDFTVSRTSGFSVQKVNDRNLRIAVGIKAEGKGGLRGDVARGLDLDEKNFNAAADVHGTFAVGIKNDWCPDLPMKIGYTWTRSPRVEIIGGVWVDITGLVDGEMKQTLDKLPGQLSAAIPCEQVRKAVADAWKAYAFPIKIENAPPMTVVVNPKSLGTSGMIVTDKDIRIVVNAKAETSLLIGSNPPALPDKGPLPPAATVAEEPGRVEIALPIQAAYDALQKAVTDAIKEPIRFDVGGKSGQLTVKGIEIYPSAEKLTVGLKFEADVPGRPFDVSGEVFLSSVPTISEDGQSIRLKDVVLSRRLDNSLWNVLSAALDGEVRRQVEKAKLDLKPQIEAALAAMRTAIADPARTGGIKLTVAKPSLKIERILPGSDALTAMTLVSADVEGELVSPFK